VLPATALFRLSIKNDDQTDVATATSPKTNKKAPSFDEAFFIQQTINAAI
jgi:hypothetical protein